MTCTPIAQGDSYLFLDDLYHIRRENQPQVIDYLHSVGKGSQHVAKGWNDKASDGMVCAWYPPIGVKLGARCRRD